MCIAIHKPAGISIPDSHLEESFASNPDGAGFAALCPKKGFIIRKGFFTLEEFNREFKPFVNRPALVHFRIATSGGINPEMCHPFPLCGGAYAMIHNGILDIKPHKGKSDTATFADGILTPLLQQGVKFDSPAFKFLVEQAIGAWNKILIMDRYGKVVIFNESAGHKLNDIWYSNSSYLPVVRTPMTPVKAKWSDAKWNSWVKGDGVGFDSYEEELQCEYCGEILEEFTREIYCDRCLREMESLSSVGKVLE